mmetsp:Transcript_16329/g.27616  ORF Transcript_16329/g.27616 Transcript_16329/m.27616 type:complete len:102 (-) Transcript_16329:132-437(-)
MKFFGSIALIAALAGEETVSGLKLHGIDDKALMGGNHWRKSWPEGAIDSSEGDAAVIEEYNVHKHEPKEEAVPHIWYEYEPHTVSMEDLNRGKFHTQVYDS